MTNAELFAFLFAPPTSDAEEILTRWILQSRRFQSFLAEYKTKVRKKLRLARTPEFLQSLLLELDIARLLIENPRCHLEYEKYGQGRERTPDLTVTFRARACFNLEVTCAQMPHEEAEGRMEKLIRIVCDKLGQSVPQMLNCLVIATEGGSLTEDEVNAAMKSLKRRVEQREGEMLSRVAFNTPAEFYKQFQWLNGIVLCSPATQGGSPKTIVWTNPQSRHPLLPDIHALLQSTISLIPANCHAQSIRSHELTHTAYLAEGCRKTKSRTTCNSFRDEAAFYSHQIERVLGGGKVINLSSDIHSLTDFKRNTNSLKQMKGDTGRTAEEIFAEFRARHGIADKLRLLSH